MTRSERLATKDKVALEKQRLFNRAGRKAREYRDNLPPEGISLTEGHPGAAGYIADADRFHTDVVGDEMVRRKAEYERKQQVTDVHRQQKVAREEGRWAEMAAKEEQDDLRWEQLRDEGVKAKKNASGVPYNMISLQYASSPDGEKLRREDEQVRHRAALRSQHLVANGDTRSQYNIINGEPRGRR